MVPNRAEGGGENGKFPALAKIRRGQECARGRDFSRWQYHIAQEKF